MFLSLYLSLFVFLYLSLYLSVSLFFCSLSVSLFLCLSFFVAHYIVLVCVCVCVCVFVGSGDFDGFLCDIDNFHRLFRKVVSTNQREPKKIGVCFSWSRFGEKSSKVPYMHIIYTYAQEFLKKSFSLDGLFFFFFLSILLFRSRFSLFCFCCSLLLFSLLYFFFGGGFLSSWLINKLTLTDIYNST